MIARPLALALVVLAPVAPASAQMATPPATPKASCGPGSLPEPGLQGRVAKADVDGGAAAAGYRCNVEEVARSGETGGFKVLRYVDKAGRECAYYDTTLLFPTNTLNPSMQLTGVAVLDMTNPARPVRTTTLVTPAMQSPHESVNISESRGILAAVAGNPAFLPGVVDVYDLTQDCRQPVLKSSAPVGFLGHESGMAPDGRTFYATSIGTGHTTPVDISNPSLPRPLGVFEFNSHGMSVSDDGLRGYMASGDGLVVVDLTEIQQRKPSPKMPEISRLKWPTMTIPQIAHPVTIKGKPYVVEVDEYSGGGGGSVSAHGPIVGAARIIDVSDERRPRVVSDVRLEVHQPANRAAIAGDYGAQNPTQGYAAHYCNVPSRVDPPIMACSMILSGLRVFDIRDPEHPREIAYFVAPPDNVSMTGGPVIDERANWAMSQPEFVPARREIWYSDGTSGFRVLRLTNGAWPEAAAEAKRPAARCAGRRLFTIRVRRPRGVTIRSARVTVDGRRVRVRRVRGRHTARVDLRRMAKKTVVVRIVSRTSRGRTLSETRRYRTCAPRARR